MAKIGVGFPFDTDGRGSIEYSNNLIKSIEDSMKQIILTKKKERPMNLEFGCDIWKISFDYDILIIKEMADVYVRDAINLWEPRVDIEEIDTTKVDEYIYIEIIYSIKNTNIPLQSVTVKYSNIE